MLILSLSVVIILLLVLIGIAFTWFIFGKVFKIENLTFKKALKVCLIVSLIGVIFKLLIIGSAFLKIDSLIFDIIFSISNFVVAILILKRMFKTSILKSTGLHVSSIIFALCFALTIRIFIVQAYKIPTGAMLDTIQIGDQILVNKFFYSAKLPFIKKCPLKRGDIVVFIYPIDKRDYIKRVVGIAGDTIQIRDKKIYINGEWEGEKSYERFVDHRHYPRKIPEDTFEKTWTSLLVKHRQIASVPNILNTLNVDSKELFPFLMGNFRDNFGPVTVPDGHIFVLGDNRDNSHDSRFWGFVPFESVKGKAFFIYWSWDEANKMVRWDRIGSSL